MAKKISSETKTMVETQSMTEAVSMAYRFADKGNVVLLSPACASFDLFENYEERGRAFKDAVRNLQGVKSYEFRIWNIEYDER